MENKNSFTSKGEDFTIDFTDDYIVIGEFEYLNINEVDSPFGKIEESIEYARKTLSSPNTYYCLVRDSKGKPVSGGGLVLV